MFMLRSYTVGIKKLILAAAFAIGAPIAASAATVSGPVLETGNLDGGVFTSIGQVETVSISPIAASGEAFSVTVFFSALTDFNYIATFSFAPGNVAPTTFTNVTATFGGFPVVLIEPEDEILEASAVAIGTGSVTDGSGNDLDLMLISGGPATSLTISGNVSTGTVLQATVTAVPLPAGVALLLTGLAGLGVVARRRSAVEA